jgi:tetratricopeptide (TPR) repeat protein
LRRLDQIVVGGIALLLILTPLCFGSVHPWAYSLMEEIIFALAALWMAKAVLEGGRVIRAGGNAALRTVAAPIAVVFALMAFETVPLPPGLLHLLSPRAYSLYERALPGWPEEAPYGDLNFNSNKTISLPTTQQVRAGAPVPFAPTGKISGPGDGNSANRSSRRRLVNRTLSFEPRISRLCLLEGLAYATLFLLIALYPFGADGEERSEEHFSRAILGTVLVGGVAIALLGLVNWATWNGKILWFFVPIDWEQPVAVLGRATGPFVDADHFANYLALILPIAVAGAFLRTDLVARKSSRALNIYSIVIVFLIVCALLLSLSRGGWAAGGIGVGLLLAMISTQSEQRRAMLTPYASGRKLMWIAVAAAALVVLALIFVGPQGREATNARLEETATDFGLTGRTTLWRTSLAMTRDFPLFGVGAGAWAELSTRYTPAPWSEFFYDRDAHNDYLQFLAEGGLFAFLALAWLLWRVAARMIRAMRGGNPMKWPLLAAILAAAGGLAFHELVDFNLHTPANAILVVILLGLGLRIATPGHTRGAGVGLKAPRALPMAAAGCALVLIFASRGQRDVSYPYFLPEAKNLRAAVVRVIRHPADSDGHFILARLGERAMGPQAYVREVRTAVWLEPADPSKRDLYADALARRGKMVQAMAEIERSVFNSPTLDTHFYLSPRLIRWIAPGTQLAVEKGFKEAVAADFPRALDNLGEFYARMNRPLDEARLYSEAAQQATDPGQRLSALIGAGKAYAAAGRMLTAEAFFRLAIREAPDQLTPYRELLQSVYVREQDMRSARTAVNDGIQNGGDPYEFNIALAQAAEQAHRADVAEAAFKSALAERPEGTQALWEMGNFYLNQALYEKAAAVFQRLADLQPSAGVFLGLAQAQEGGYHYYAAKNSYARAIALAPADRNIAAFYAAFRQRMAKDQAQDKELASPLPSTAIDQGNDN